MTQCNISPGCIYRYVGLRTVCVFRIFRILPHDYIRVHFRIFYRHSLLHFLQTTTSFSLPIKIGKKPLEIQFYRICRQIGLFFTFENNLIVLWESLLFVRVALVSKCMIICVMHKRSCVCWMRPLFPVAGHVNTYTGL